MSNAYNNQAFNGQPRPGPLADGQHIITPMGRGRIVSILRVKEEPLNPLALNARAPLAITVVLDHSRLPVVLYLSDFVFTTNSSGQITAQQSRNSNL